MHTRDETKKRYQLASMNQKVMVFIRDFDNRILRSYVLPLDDEAVA